MRRSDRWNHPHYGYGLQLTHEHFAEALASSDGIDVFELIAENLLEARGAEQRTLRQLAERGPVLLHGVGLSIGGLQEFDAEYLRGIRRLADIAHSPFISDHMCWSSYGGFALHDFLPLPYTEEALTHTVKRVRRLQESFERLFLVENQATYFEFRGGQMREWEFLTQLAQQADCGLLLDVDAVFINAFNHGFDPYLYLDALPADRIVYYHLAGHSEFPQYYRATHSASAGEAVMRLYRYSLGRTGPRTSLLAWDSALPPFDDLREQVRRIRQRARRTLKKPPSRLAEPPPTAAVDGPRLQDAQHLTTAYILGWSEGPSAVELVAQSPRMNAAQQLDIYRDQYRWRMPHELGFVYGHVRRFLGVEQFTRLVHQYVQRYPPDHPDILRLRRRFPWFLRNQGFVFDLACLELAMRDLHDAEEEETVAPQEVSAHIVLRFASAVRILAFQYNVNEYVQDASGTVVPRLGRNWVLLYRRNQVVHRLSLSASIARFVRLLLRGVALGEAASRALHLEASHATVQSLIQVLLEGGMVRSLQLLHHHHGGAAAAEDLG